MLVPAISKGQPSYPECFGMSFFFFFSSFRTAYAFVSVASAHSEKHWPTIPVLPSK